MCGCYMAYVDLPVDDLCHCVFVSNINYVNKPYSSFLCLSQLIHHKKKRKKQWKSVSRIVLLFCTLFKRLFCHNKWTWIRWNYKKKKKSKQRLNIEQLKWMLISFSYFDSKSANFWRLSSKLNVNRNKKWKYVVVKSISSKMREEEKKNEKKANEWIFMPES